MTELLREDTSINPVIKDRIEKIQQGIVPVGYRKSDVGIIPKEWNVFKLVDVSKDGGKYGINARAVTFNKSLPKYLRITDISDDGKYISENKKSVDNKNSKNYLLQKNDIVFARTGNTTGKTYLYQEKDKDLIYAGFLIKYSIDDQIANPKLIFYHTQTNRYWNWVKIMSARSGQPGINSKEYNNLQFSLGSLKEQQKIADILSTWDRAIELKESLIKEKEEQKKGFMEKLLNEANYSQEWTKIKILSFCKTYSGGTPSRQNKNYYRNGTIPWIKSGELNSNYVYNTEESITREGLENSSAKLVEENNILVALYGATAGVVAITKIEAAINQAILAIIPKEEICSKSYLYYYLKWIMPKIISKYTQGGQPNLNSENLRNIKVAFPSNDLQNKIVSLLENADRKINLLNQELDLLKEQKKGLMQLLLTGIVRVGEVEKLE